MSRRPTPHPLLRAFACLIVAVALLALTELALRLIGFRFDPKPPLYIWNPHYDLEFRDNEAMHRFHPFWFWEPRPGSRVAGCGSERINAAGFRGQLRAESPPAGVSRVITLGDSSTFGMGVCEPETFTLQLEQLLSHVEALNFGVIGFAAFQGEKLLSGRAARYRPDVVLAAFGAVDELMPAIDYDIEEKYKITSRVSPFWIRARDLLAPLRLFQLAERTVAPNQGRSLKLDIKTNDNWLAWNAGSPDYRRTQSLSSYERSLAALADQAVELRADLVLVIPPRRAAVEHRWPWAMEYTEATARFASSREIPLVDVRSAFRSIPDADATLFVDDYHPNASGHALYAVQLAAVVEEVLKARKGRR